MHWYVGIDEAGYGSSLGPFVMAFTAVGFESKPTIPEYWSMLSDWVFDHKKKVADSKINWESEIQTNLQANKWSSNAWSTLEDFIS